MSTAGHDADPRLLRLLAALVRPGARLDRDAALDRAEVAMKNALAPVLVVPDDLVRTALSHGLLRESTGEGASVSDEGRAFLRRAASGEDPYRRQHLEVREGPRSPGRHESAPMIVDNESPLAWLHSRKGRDGAPMISKAQFCAGERLRSDYTRAGLVPRLGVDLSRPPMPRGQGSSGNRVAESLDHAIAARQRVDHAVRAVGAELGSLLIDVCCELVGLEEIERRRSWPRRSGKLVLRIALDRLATHYGIEESVRGPDHGRMRHWGGAGYRPGAGS